MESGRSVSKVIFFLSFQFKSIWKKKSKGMVSCPRQSSAEGQLVWGPAWHVQKQHWRPCGPVGPPLSSQALGTSGLRRRSKRQLPLHCCIYFKNSVILTRKPYILTGKKAIKYNFMYFMYSRYEHLINFNAAFCRVDKWDLEKWRYLTEVTQKFCGRDNSQVNVC